MPKPTWLRGLIVPISIVSILFLAFAAYYLYWVPDRRSHLDDRGFRYLKTLSDQIRITLNTYDKMLDYAVAAGVARDAVTDEAIDNRFQSYLNHVASQLVVPDREESDHVIGSDYDDPPKIAVNADEGTHFLYLAFSHNREGEGKAKLPPVKFTVRTDLDKLINSQLGPPGLSPFDVVLVAKSDGKVFFQKSLTGIEVAQIKSLKDASGEVKGEDEKQIDAGWLLPVSRLEEVWIGGARYRLYSQPLQLGLLPADPKGKQPQKATDEGKEPKQNSTKASATPTASSERNAKAESGTKSDSEVHDVNSAQGTSDVWVLCGLVRADRYRSESQLIPYSYILLLLAAILLAAASYPFLRLYFSCPGERLRAQDVARIAVFTCFVAAVLTLILADVYFWNLSFGPATESDMAKTAKALNASFKLERKAAFAELDALNSRLHPSNSDPSKPDSVGAVRQVDDELKALDQTTVSLDFSRNDKDRKKGECTPSAACTVNILTIPELKSILAGYPYPFFAFWSDSEGQQRIKWTTRQHATPFVPLDDASVPFYPEVKRALKSRAKSPVRPEGIGSQYSPTTGQNITTFWKVDLGPENQSGDSYQGEKARNRYSYSLVTQPISLYNAVLPSGFQFAVLTPDGRVVFHSDTTRNLRENFFAETDQDPDLRSRVLMRSEGVVTANYIGRPHRMYVMPMAAANQDGVWSIVVFRDLHLEETVNLEMLILVTILFLLYAAMITLIMMFACWRPKGHATGWFWPDSRKAQQYRRILVTSLVAVALLLLLFLFAPQGILLLCAAVIPAAVLIWALLMLYRREDQQALPDKPDQAASKQWQSAYFQVAATLVVLIAVLPCLCAFKVAADFGQSILVKHTLLKLADDFDGRAIAMQDLYQDVKLGGFWEQILAGPDDQDASRLLQESATPSTPSMPVFSYHKLLNDTVVKSDEQDLDGCTAEASNESSLLSTLTYPYNESAANDRHLAEGNSDVWKWSSCTRGLDRVIKLTRHTTGGKARSITATWRPFHIPWRHWVWWLGVAVLVVAVLGVAALLAAVYWLVRLSSSRVFLLNLDVPSPTKAEDSELNTARLMADLPMNLLLIGPETCRPIANLIHRSDVQVREAEELLQVAAAQAKPAGAADVLRWRRRFSLMRKKLGKGVPAISSLSSTASETGSDADAIAAVIDDGRPLVLRNFECLPDNADSVAKAHAALTRVLSALGKRVIIISSLDPVMISSIEASDRWRTLLRSFVRIDRNSGIVEDDADYKSRMSADSYFRWLFAGMPRAEKLVMLQLAQEDVVNPNSSEIVRGLMQQGLIQRRQGLLAITDTGFAKFLPDALPGHTVKLWEKEMAGPHPFSLQTSLAILGVGVGAFLVYTQGDVFQTWVASATGVVAAVPKILQLFENFQSKSAGKS